MLQYGKAAAKKSAAAFCCSLKIRSESYKSEALSSVLEIRNIYLVISQVYSIEYDCLFYTFF